jgi:hypothetical protein
MINLLDIQSSIFEKGSVIAELYNTCSKGIPHKLNKIMIKPFKEDMKQANNIILFVDNNYNITSGQIGKYTDKKGLHVITF